MEALKHLLGTHAINEKSDPYRSAEFTEYVGGSSGEAVGTDVGRFRDVLLDSPGTRTTKINRAAGSLINSEAVSI
jgi:hypothetical protein